MRKFRCTKVKLLLPTTNTPLLKPRNMQTSRAGIRPWVLKAMVQTKRNKLTNKIWTSVQLRKLKPPRPSIEKRPNNQYILRKRSLQMEACCNTPNKDLSKVTVNLRTVPSKIVSSLANKTKSQKLREQSQQATQLTNHKKVTHRSKKDGVPTKSSYQKMTSRARL